MDQSVKEEWVRALRSGEYRQVKGVLHRDGGYCALGVLCSIAVDHGIVPCVPEDTELPYPAHDWADILSTEEAEVASMNDAGETFGSIADWIERKL
jgi:hypothetical protein